MKYIQQDNDIIAEVRSIKHFFLYLTLLFTDGLTLESRRIPRREWSIKA